MSFIFSMYVSLCFDLAQLYKNEHFFHYSAYIPLNNYLVFNDVDGLYTYTFEAERKVSSSILMKAFLIMHTLIFKY